MIKMSGKSREMEMTAVETGGKKVHNMKLRLSGIRMSAKSPLVNSVNKAGRSPAEDAPQLRKSRNDEELSSVANPSFDWRDSSQDSP